MDIEDVDVFVGIDIGRAEHWATAQTTDGALYDPQPAQQLPTTA